MKKKVSIFGATGGTGQELVRQALQQGHQVTAFVRNPKKIKLTDDNLRIVKGDVLNYEDVLSGVANQDVIMCCIGLPASDKSSLRQKGTANIIKAMRNKGVHRLVCQTSLGFGDSKVVLPWYMKYLIVPLILENAFKDHALQESEIEKSDLDWTIVRPGNMTNGEKTGSYKFGFKPTEKIKLKISRADVAQFMLNLINKKNYHFQKLGISY